MPLSAATYEQLSLEDDDRIFELIGGHLEPRRDESRLHNSVVSRLFGLLCPAVQIGSFEIRGGRIRVITTTGDYLIPDLVVLDEDVLAELRGSERLEAYTSPVPLLVEVLTAATDELVRPRIAAYRRRGDALIWLIDVPKRTLHSWAKQEDGTYVHGVFGVGDSPAPIPSLPGVYIDFGHLFR